MALPALNTPEEQQDTLNDEAWALAAEALRDGRLTLRSGKVIQLDAKDMLRHVQWLAGLGKRKNKSNVFAKERFLKETS